MKITIYTPIPSINSMYRGRRYLTNAGKEAKHAIGLEILARAKFKLNYATLALNVTFYFGNKRKNDIDNRLKALLDCCTGILYEDDSKITELHVYKKYDAKNPRTEIEIL